MESRMSKEGEKEYLVHWQGYEPEDNSWEPKSSFKYNKNLIKDFELKNKGKLSSTGDSED